MKKTMLMVAFLLPILFVASCDGTIPEEEKGPQISCMTRAAEYVTTNSVHLTGQVIFSGAVSKEATAWFLLGKDEATVATSGEKINAGLVSSTNNMVYANVDGLDPGTDYYYMIAAKIDEKTAKGEIMKFTTAQLKLTVTTGGATSDEENGVTIKGSFKVEGTELDRDPMVYFYMGETSAAVKSALAKVSETGDVFAGNSVEGVEAIQGSCVGNNKVEHNFSRGLKHSKKYYYAVAIDALGVVGCGAVKSFTTSAPVGVVNLGLPSGTLWATHNIGADRDYDPGSYFAWGEVSTKGDYSAETYIWCNGVTEQLTKYCTDPDYWKGSGSCDNLKVLMLEDDAASVALGWDYRMPTREDVKELIDNCEWKWEEVNGYKVCTLKSKINGNSIVLPAGGNKYAKGSDKYNEVCCYWTSSLYEEKPYIAWAFAFADKPSFNFSYSRIMGYNVRPVVKIE